MFCINQFNVYLQRHAAVDKHFHMCVHYYRQRNSISYVQFLESIYIYMHNFCIKSVIKGDSILKLIMTIYIIGIIINKNPK